MARERQRLATSGARARIRSPTASGTMISSASVLTTSTNGTEARCGRRSATHIGITRAFAASSTATSAIA
jgi:hypothetical protein